MADSIFSILHTNVPIGTKTTSAYLSCGALSTEVTVRNGLNTATLLSGYSFGTLYWPNYDPNTDEIVSQTTTISSVTVSVHSDTCSFTIWPFHISLKTESGSTAIIYKHPNQNTAENMAHDQSIITGRQSGNGITKGSKVQCCISLGSWGVNYSSSGEQLPLTDNYNSFADNTYTISISKFTVSVSATVQY
jgi:hypothetical protein